MKKYMIIKEKIFKAFVLEENPIPTETTLCNLYGISRTTVRKALDSLVEDGSVKKVRGKGYINANTPSIVNNLNTQGLYNDNLNLGNITKSKVIRKILMPADEILALKLNIKVNEQVFYMIRLRYVNEKKFSITENYIPLDLFPSIETVDFNKISLWEYFRTQSVHVTLKKQIVAVRRSLESEQHYLDLSVSDPVMVVQNIAYFNKRPVDYSIITTGAYDTKLHYSME